MHAPYYYYYYYFIAFLFASASLGLVESASSVRLTKQCFGVGEQINVRFVDVTGEGIFVGLYPTSALPNRQLLPEITSQELKEWTLTCGRRDNCDTWPERGLVQLPTDGLPEDEYIIAISGNRSGRTPQALTREFRLGGCSTAPSSSQIVFGPTIAAGAPVPQQAPVPQPVQAAPVPRPTAQPTPAPVPNPAPASPFVVGGGINAVLDDARFQIENLIRNDGDLTGKVSQIGSCHGQLNFLFEFFSFLTCLMFCRVLKFFSVSSFGIP